MSQEKKDAIILQAKIVLNIALPGWVMPEFKSKFREVFNTDVTNIPNLSQGSPRITLAVGISQGKKLREFLVSFFKEHEISISDHNFFEYFPMF